MTQNPSLNPSILLAPAEDSYLAYNPTSDRLHTLNPVAALITELCDGSRTIDDIRSIVSPLLPTGQSGEVDRLIQQGLEAGLFVAAENSGTAHRELTAKELYNLAKRLENAGKIQTALICERRVTEMAPDNPGGWYYLGELAEMMGRREETRAAYEKYVELKPDDCEEIRHILIALRDEAPPARMSDKCILQIYDGFADTFDARLLQDLGYRGPERVLDLIAPLLAARPDQAGEPRPTLQVLDLGCGTGLAALSFKPYAAKLVGVDLSPEMLALAEKRGLYDRLDRAEVTAWLDACTESFDLVLCCDCLIYFGDLGDVATRVAKILKPSGIFAFTTERGERYPWRLNESGRYEHHPNHAREVAAAAGLEIAKFEESFLRTEYAKEITGLFVALVKPSR